MLQGELEVNSETSTRAMCDIIEAVLQTAQPRILILQKIW